MVSKRAKQAEEQPVPSKPAKSRSAQASAKAQANQQTTSSGASATLQRTLGNQQLARLAGNSLMRTPATAAQPTPAVPATRDERMAHVMKLLVDKYKYPVNGAAGLVGNLFAESGLLPNRIEGSKEATPMKAKDAHNKLTDFTPEEVMNRKYKVQGPKKPGIGLAQWTTAGRRKGLFEHEYEGKKLGVAILNHLDAQVDYLVKELESNYSICGFIRSISSSLKPKLGYCKTVYTQARNRLCRLDHKSSHILKQQCQIGSKMASKVLKTAKKTHR